MLFPFLAVLSIIFSLIAGYFYIRDTLQGSTSPNRVSWLLWGIIPTISTIAILSEGFTWAVAPVFMAGAMSYLVVIASFKNKKSAWKGTKIDLICGITSLLAISLWILTKDPLIAIILTAIADGIAFLPTLKKGYHAPETESWEPYFSGGFGGLVGIIIAQGISLEYIFPAYLFLFNSIMLFLLFRKKD